MSESFDELCKALATPMPRRRAIAVTAISLATGLAMTAFPALAQAISNRRRGCRGGTRVRSLGLGQPNPCNANQTDCNPGGVQTFCCNSVGDGEVCCVFDCCPRTMPKCCTVTDSGGIAVIAKGCCPADGDCCGPNERDGFLCCESGFRSCADDRMTCCPKDRKCVVDLAVAGGKGCCPPLSDGNGLLCGAVCCVEGQFCDVQHKQCRRRKPGGK